MRLHPNAKTTPKARALLITRLEAGGWPVRQVAAAAGITVRTVYKWRRGIGPKGARDSGIARTRRGAARIGRGRRSSRRSARCGGAASRPS